MSPLMVRGFGATETVDLADQELREDTLYSLFQRLDPATGGIRAFGTSGLRVTLVPEPGLTPKGLLDPPFRFQVPPLEEFTIQRTYEHSEWTTIRGNTHSRPGALALATVQFQSLFVDWDPTWAVVHMNRPNPLALVDQLTDLQLHGRPFRLVVGSPAMWGFRPHLNMLATLRTLGSTEKAGEPDTQYADVQFSEYREPRRVSRRKLGSKRGDPAPIRGRAKPKLPAVVEVWPDGQAQVPGRTWVDTQPVTLHELAKWFYSAAGLWTLIARANGLTGVTGSQSLGDIARRDAPGASLKLKVPVISSALGSPSEIGGGFAAPGS